MAGSDCSDVPCTPGDDDCVGYLCQCPPGYDTTVVTTEVSLGVVDGVAITANKHSFVCTDIDECAIQVITPSWQKFAFPAQFPNHTLSKNF